jgi:transcriptional regulator with XRE-family HTH domain
MKYRFGDKIRSVRERRSLTLKDVAEGAGVSESLVSQIERNKVAPAIDTLLSLAEVLDIDLEYLFADFRKERAVRIVRANERAEYTRPGVSYERLAEVSPDGRAGIEAYLISLEPGAHTGHSEYGHQGFELGIVAEGKAELSVGTRVYILEAGDSASFQSDIPHTLKNAGDAPLRTYWMVSPPKGDIFGPPTGGGAQKE